MRCSNNVLIPRMLSMNSYEFITIWNNDWMFEFLRKIVNKIKKKLLSEIIILPLYGKFCISKNMALSLWQRAFDATISVLPHFFQLYLHDNDAKDIFKRQIVSKNTLCVCLCHMLTSKEPLNQQFTWGKQRKKGF